MDWLHALYPYLDTLLIAPFRFISPPILGFYLGCISLAFWCVLIGHFTKWAALAANFKNLDKENREMVRMHNLSFSALAAKEKKAYKAANSQANDAFGKYFFAQIAITASFLWPAPLAMGWLDTRFTDISFMLPGIDTSLGFAFPFILIYIATCILFSKIKAYVPFLARADTITRKINENGGKMRSIADLASK